MNARRRVINFKNWDVDCDACHEDTTYGAKLIFEQHLDNMLLVYVVNVLFMHIHSVIMSDHMFDQFLSVWYFKVEFLLRNKKEY